jgi:hypothetical protein
MFFINHQDIPIVIIDADKLESLWPVSTKITSSIDKFLPLSTHNHIWYFLSKSLMICTCSFSTSVKSFSQISFHFRQNLFGTGPVYLATSKKELKFGFSIDDTLSLMQQKYN